jgi:hypothetical protein
LLIVLVTVFIGVAIYAFMNPRPIIEARICFHSFRNATMTKALVIMQRIGAVRPQMGRVCAGGDGDDWPAGVSEHVADLRRTWTPCFSG